MPAASTPAAPTPRAALVLLAAGEGRRSGHATNKVLLPLAGRRVFTWSIRWARLLPMFVETVVVVREGDQEQVEAICRREVEGPVRFVVGGASRHESEWAALQALAPAIAAGDLDVVAIHDAARPLASSDVFATVTEQALTHGGAIPVADQRSLAPREPTEVLADRLVAVQTPQAFRAGPLLGAYAAAHADGFVGTDTASCMERYTDLPVRCVPGDATNVKITFPEDLFLAERLLEKVDYDLSGGRTPPHGRRLPHLPTLRRARGEGTR